MTRAPGCRSCLAISPIPSQFPSLRGRHILGLPSNRARFTLEARRSNILTANLIFCGRVVGDLRQTEWYLTCLYTPVYPLPSSTDSSDCTNVSQAYINATHLPQIGALKKASSFRRFLLRYHSTNPWSMGPS